MLRKSEAWNVYAALLPVVIGIVIATGAVLPSERPISVPPLVMKPGVLVFHITLTAFNKYPEGVPLILLQSACCNVSYRVRIEMWTLVALGCYA